MRLFSGYMVRGMLVCAAAIWGLQGCTKTETEDYNTQSTAYYKYSKGNIRDYDFDSTSYDWASGKILKYHWLIRETVTDTFRDLEDELAYRLEQFQSTDSGKSYIFYAINTAKSDATGFQRVEDNQRYMKLAVPIADKKKWDGNIYNSQGFQEYKYTGVKKPYVNQYLDFPDCVFVSQQEDSTFLSSDRKSEVYAKDVGMVYRLNQSIRYNNNGEPQGYIVEWKLRKFWEK